MFATSQSAYVNNSVSTASPVRLLLMLLDRLVLDVRRAQEAMADNEQLQVHEHLVHAQDIVIELRSSLDAKAFTGGEQLDSLYEYLYRRLVEANTRKDVWAASECLTLATDLASMWREAAGVAGLVPQQVAGE